MGLPPRPNEPPLQCIRVSGSPFEEETNTAM